MKLNRNLFLNEFFKLFNERGGIEHIKPEEIESMREKYDFNTDTFQELSLEGLYGMGVEKAIRYDIKNNSPTQKVREEQDPVKKFILYRQDSLESRFDCDSSELVERICYQFEFWGADWGKSFPLEFDTMNSFYTTYRQFLIVTDKEFWNKDFIKFCLAKGEDYYSLKKANYNKLKHMRYDWLLSDSVYAHYQEANEIMTEFATLTHSIGNILILPKSVNTKRGIEAKIQDYLDLTLLCIYYWYRNPSLETPLKKILDENEHWLSKFYANTHAGGYREQGWDYFVVDNSLMDFVDESDDWKPIMFWEGHSFDSPFPKDKEQILSFSNIVNNAILKRGKQVFDDIKSLHNRYGDFI